jgi:uncharacterized protein (DUF2225 family)
MSAPIKPDTATHNVAEVKRRLFALLHDSNLVNDYIRLYGAIIDIKCIKEYKENIAKAAKIEIRTSGKDPIYTIKVKCPVCLHENIECCELRAKSQKVTQTKFLVPVYEGAMGYSSVNYAMEAVTVCPKCLFASPDKKDFSRYETTGHAEVKSQLPSNVLSAINEKTAERQTLVNLIKDHATYFKTPRIEDAAIASYRLAMMRAHVEVWFEQPYGYYKLGSYVLKIAKIFKDMGQSDTEFLTEAVGFFGEAFRTSNCPSEEIEMQVIYLLVALNLRLGDQAKAGSFIGVFSNLRSNRLTEIRENPELTTVTIDKWNAKAKLLWEDRDRVDLFD